MNKPSGILMGFPWLHSRACAKRWITYTLKWCWDLLRHTIEAQAQGSQRLESISVG